MYKTIRNHVVQNETKYDAILHRKGFDVNMFLFKTSKGYKKIIQSIVDHMWDLLRVSFDDYGEIRGISGANVGVPLNIIGIVVTKEAEEVCKKKEGGSLFMINPRITKKSKKLMTVKSNCGSLNLPEKIEVERHEWVEVEYFDTHGNLKKNKFTGAFGSTVQHEIDHNLGVLITDKQKAH